MHFSQIWPSAEVHVYVHLGAHFNCIPLPVPNIQLRTLWNQFQINTYFVNEFMSLD